MFIIVDSSVIKHNAVYAVKASGELRIDYNSFFHAFMNSILGLKKSFSCTTKSRMILAIDRKSQYEFKGQKKWGYWRHKYYDEHIGEIGDKFGEYKAGRVETKKEDKDVDWERIDSIYYQAIKIIDEYTDIQVIQVPGVEADDIMAIGAQLSKQPVVMCTSDKDLKTLISDKIKHYNPKTKTYSEPLSEIEIQTFFLKGDSGDSIPAVRPGWADGKWAKYFENNTLEDYFKEFPDKKKIYDINKQLMSLNIHDLPRNIVDSVVQQLKVADKGLHFKKISLRKAVAEFDVERYQNENNRIRPLIERLEDFRLTEDEYEGKNVQKLKKQEEDESKFDRFF